MKTKNHKNRMRPARRDSEMSNLRVLGILRSLGILGVKTVRQEVRMKTKNHKTKTRPAQRDSKISILGASPYRPYRPLFFKITPAQRDSGNYILEMGEHGHTERNPYYVDKEFDGCFMGRWEDEPMSKMQNGLPQRYSKMSNLKIETENSFPQRHSKMSNSVLLAIRPVPQSGDPGSYAGRMGRMEYLPCK